jgi:hypothetical protein
VESGVAGRAHSPALKLAGPRSGIQKARFVIIRDKKALEALLKEHNPHAEVDLKALDFTKHSVIAYFAGTKPTGGFGVELIGVERQKDSANVKIRLLKPGKGSMVIQILTAPFLIESVDRLPSHVTHTVVEQERTAR